MQGIRNSKSSRDRKIQAHPEGRPPGSFLPASSILTAVSLVCACLCAQPVCGAPVDSDRVGLAGEPADTSSGGTPPKRSGSTAGKKKPQVLDPSRFFGEARAGYLAARAIPDICEKLFCYCGCDLTDCHGSLLDCFTSDHGVDCHICQEEAIVALKLHRKGRPLADIQKAIDKRYAKEYPFEVESPALRKYKSARLWDIGHKERSASGLGAIESPAAAGAKGRLRKDGSCCAGKEDKSK